jgi:hypothetical protein
MSGETTVLYVCLNCFSIDTAPGNCPNCGRALQECDPGDPNNPCRKPPMDAQGHLLSRAPLWWLAQSAPYIREQLKQKMSNK